MDNTETYELNNLTREVKKADYRTGSIFISASMDESTTTTTMILVERDNCKYFNALNLKNAKRKAERL